MPKRHWFQYIAYGVLTIFFGLMAYVVVIAFSRPSGSTGMDAATIQKIRYDAQPASHPQ